MVSVRLRTPRGIDANQDELAQGRPRRSGSTSFGGNLQPWFLSSLKRPLRWRFWRVAWYLAARRARRQIRPWRPTRSAPKPTDATIKIVSPAQGGVLSGGAITVSVNYSGPTLVPGAEAKKLDDYHLHYFLDEDAAAYLGGGKSIPAGNPHIVHSAAREVTFDKLTPGQHTLTVVMSGNNHVAVAPVLTDSVTFTVQ